jgi:hypothetical protein
VALVLLGLIALGVALDLVVVFGVNPATTLALLLILVTIPIPVSALAVVLSLGLFRLSLVASGLRARGSRGPQAPGRRRRN